MARPAARRPRSLVLLLACSWFAAWAFTGHALPRHQRSTALRADDKDTSTWAAQWLQSELARSPVLLLAGTDSSRLKECKEALKAACVRYETVEVDQLGAMSTPVLDELKSYGRPAGSSHLFVGGALLDSLDIQRLQDACQKAGAKFTKLRAEPNMTWSQDEKGRWLLPKNFGGRRWYTDEADMADRGFQVSEFERLQYNLMYSGRGGGEDNNKISNEGLELLWQDGGFNKSLWTGDAAWEADMNQTVAPWSWKQTASTPDWSYKTRKGMDPEETFDSAANFGLPQAMVTYANYLSIEATMRELRKRKCFDALRTCKDLNSMRYALLQDMAKEQRFSPTELSIAPGLATEVLGPQLEKEIEADTDTPLLVHFIDKESPQSYIARGEFYRAARQIRMAARSVWVNCGKYPGFISKFGIQRFPMLAWLQARTGAVLFREYGKIPSRSIVERTRLLAPLKELPESPQKEAAALVAAAGKIRRKMRKDRLWDDGGDKRETGSSKSSKRMSTLATNKKTAGYG